MNARAHGPLHLAYVTVNWYTLGVPRIPWFRYWQFSFYEQTANKSKSGASCKGFLHTSIFLIIPMTYFLSTQPSTRMQRAFVLMNVSSALLGLPFVIASAGLSRPSIHRISQSSRLSYDCRKAIISIMSLFSFVVPSLTRHS